MAKSITILVYEDFGFLDVVGPADVFTIANQRAGKTLYKLQITAVGRKRSVQAESGIRLCVDSDIGEVTRTHTLSERLSVSERHFVRLFRTRTGTTPARWVERIRIDKARERLEQSSDSIESVATASGFASVETMRQAFRRVVGVSPGDYRKHHRFPKSVHQPANKSA